MIELPDVPRWVEAHGIAADPEHWRTPLGGGFALGHDAAKLIVVAGAADPDPLAALARSYPQHTLLLELFTKRGAECIFERIGVAVDEHHGDKVAVL